MYLKRWCPGSIQMDSELKAGLCFTNEYKHVASLTCLEFSFTINSFFCCFYWIMLGDSCEKASSSNDCPCVRTAAHLVRHGFRNNLSRPTRTLFSSPSSIQWLSFFFPLSVHHSLSLIVYPFVLIFKSKIPQFRANGHFNISWSFIFSTDDSTCPNEMMHCSP